MPKYKIGYTFSGFLEAEVTAQNEQEARQILEEQFPFEIKAFDFQRKELHIGSVEPFIEEVQND